ncbi:hypothetical protein FNW52_04145 [Flavobacterium sp. ZT3R18]|uniref:DoxX-like family protein n=1 Tax=Flavobacterium sp. ZT3R18 TaxID=2594429 RepID=UPI001179E883|nr:DoxX-like family protein [Flavobacterium sp. ZT3R18]TRX38100.1 hypothetical protein FNW52_04145 [Flavobacterium sp. ZT3R18]
MKEITQNIAFLKLNIIKNPLEIIARIGVFGTFLGHGILAIGVNPKWIPLLTSVGFTTQQSIFLMPIIGIMDILVAITTLLYPVRQILIWASIWAFLTALSRPFSGEPFLEFVERAANWCLPLVLLMFQYSPAKKPLNIS